MFHLPQFDQCLPLNEDQRRQQMEDDFQDPLWPFWVLGDAFWIDQRTGHVLRLYQQYLSRKAWRFCDSVSRWYPYLHWKQRQTICGGRLMGVRATAEVSAICQSKKVLISLGKVRFLGYIISHQGIWIKEKQIKAICDWLEPQSVRDI